VVICLERGTDLHMAQLMPRPLTVSCFSKIQIGFTFLVPAPAAHLGSPGKRPLNGRVLQARAWSSRVLFSSYSSVVANRGSRSDRPGITCVCVGTAGVRGSAQRALLSLHGQRLDGVEHEQLPGVEPGARRVRASPARHGHHVPRTRRQDQTHTGIRLTPSRA